MILEPHKHAVHYTSHFLEMAEELFPSSFNKTVGEDEADVEEESAERRSTGGIDDLF